MAAPWISIPNPPELRANGRPIQIDFRKWNQHSPARTTTCKGTRLAETSCAIPVGPAMADAPVLP
jgi:hypothetical protein